MFLDGVPFWQFLDFIVSHRTPLTLLLTPFIKFLMLTSTCATSQEYFLHQVIQRKLKGEGLEAQRGRASMLVELVSELKQISAELNVPGKMTLVFKRI